MYSCLDYRYMPDPMSWRLSVAYILHISTDWDTELYDSIQIIVHIKYVFLVCNIWIIWCKHTIYITIHTHLVCTYIICRHSKFHFSTSNISLGTDVILGAKNTFGEATFSIPYMKDLLQTEFSSVSNVAYISTITINVGPFTETEICIDFNDGL